MRTQWDQYHRTAKAHQDLLPILDLALDQKILNPEQMPGPSRAIGLQD